MNVFDYDIIGTYLNSSSTEERKKALALFTQQISEIASILNISDLPFRFFSSSDLKLVLNCAKELLPYTKGTPIRVTSLYSDSYHYKNGTIDKITEKNKADQIIKKIELDVNKNGILRIFYADDQEINIEIIKEYISIMHPEVEFIGFVPGTNHLDTKQIYYSSLSGLDGLNECLGKYKKLLMQEMKK